MVVCSVPVGRGFTSVGLVVLNRMDAGVGRINGVERCGCLVTKLGGVLVYVLLYVAVVFSRADSIDGRARD